MTATNYFTDNNGRGIKRELLRWAVAADRLLYEWETDLAVLLDTALGDTPGVEQCGESSSSTVWDAQTKRHLALVSIRHMLTALQIARDAGITTIAISEQDQDDLIGMRDLNEHWEENQAIFNRNPRGGAPTHRSGKTWAAENPSPLTPYGGIDWGSDVGPRITLNVPSAVIHDVIDEIIDKANQWVHQGEGWADLIPKERPRAFRQTPSGWWPDHGGDD